MADLCWDVGSWWVFREDPAKALYFLQVCQTIGGAPQEAAGNTAQVDALVDLCKSLCSASDKDVSARDRAAHEMLREEVGCIFLAFVTQRLFLSFFSLCPPSHCPRFLLSS